MNRRGPQDSPTKAARRSGRSLIGRLAAAVAGAVLSLLALPFLLLAGWGLLFHVPTLAAVAFTAALILLPLFNHVRAIRRLKLGVSFVLVPATLALGPLMIGEVDQQVEKLSRKPRSDTDSFSLPDRLGIYGLNVVMGAVGYPLYPEASKETLLMMLEPRPPGRRVFYSDFALGSRKLRDSLRSFVSSLRSDDTASSRSLEAIRIAWDRSDYGLSHPEARYALALNQTLLQARAERRGNRWLIDVRHRMRVEYPESVLVVLVARPRLRVEEGLFWVLQNCGWLHPYTAEYRFQVYSDDPRLK